MDFFDIYVTRIAQLLTEPISTTLDIRPRWDDDPPFIHISLIASGKFNLSTKCLRNSKLCERQVLDSGPNIGENIETSSFSEN